MKSRSAAPLEGGGVEEVEEVVVPGRSEAEAAEHTGDAEVLQAQHEGPGDPHEPGEGGLAAEDAPECREDCQVGAG